MSSRDRVDSNRDPLDVMMGPTVHGVERAVRSVDPDARRMPDGTWHVTMTNGRRMGIHVRLAHQWVELATRAPQAIDTSASPWSLLRANASLNGGTRLARGGALTDLRAEIFVGPVNECDAPVDRDLPSRVVSACAAMHDAYGVLCDAKRLEHASDAVPSARTEEPDDSAANRLAALCTEVGWRTAPLVPGTSAVALDTYAGSVEAHLSLLRDARLRAVVPLTSATSALSPASSAAIALLLLGVSASTRLVKGSVRRSGAGEIVAIETAHDEPVHSAAALERVLSALSVAADEVAREVRMLENEELATEYLALRHPAWTRRHLLVTVLSATEDQSCPQPQF